MMDQPDREILDDLLVQLRGDHAPLSVQMLEVLTGIGPASATMAAWWQGHDGQSVYTAQFDRRRSDWWLVPSRLIDAHSHRGRVLFANSARDYAGMRVIAASAKALIVTDDWHWVAYAIAE